MDTSSPDENAAWITPWLQSSEILKQRTHLSWAETAYLKKLWSKICVVFICSVCGYLCSNRKRIHVILESCDLNLGNVWWYNVDGWRLGREGSIRAWCHCSAFPGILPDTLCACPGLPVSSGYGSSAYGRLSYPSELMPKSCNLTLVTCNAQVGWPGTQRGSCPSAAGAHTCKHAYSSAHAHCWAQAHRRCLSVNIFWEQGFSAAWDVCDTDKTPKLLPYGKLWSIFLTPLLWKACTI